MSEELNDQYDQRRNELLVLSNVMRSTDGRAYFYKFLNNLGVFRNTHVNCPIDNAFNNGKKDVGYKLTNELKEADCDLYSLMIKENCKL